MPPCSILFYLTPIGLDRLWVLYRPREGARRLGCYSDAYDRSLRTGGRASRRKPRLALHLGRESETQRG